MQLIDDDDDPLLEEQMLERCLACVLARVRARALLLPVVCVRECVCVWYCDTYDMCLR